ncbi:M23 family metallopeptidase [Mycetocola sp. 2940]|uniref:M23 family metallopeptidase n=1 Tax=Mycetocola sp. 2940 TaxID=3156452 RepID=UPI0033986D26
MPSHGADVLGERYAIDFVGVDTRRRTSTICDRHTLFGTERPERFVGFGRPILAPVDGIVVGLHDGEPDHEARRSPLALVPYHLGQKARLREGVAAVAGNFVVLALPDRRTFVALVHLRRDSLRVNLGDHVARGDPLAQCGNSGNSTQPHLHLQAMDSDDLPFARGIPITFRRYREQAAGRPGFELRTTGVPGEGAVVQPAE